jgi:hypothetical protein
VKEKEKIRKKFIKIIEYYLGKKGCKWELKEDIRLRKDIIEKLNGTTIEEAKKAFGIHQNESAMYFISLIVPLIENKIIYNKRQSFVIIGEQSQSFWQWSKKQMGNDSPELLFVIPTLTKIDGSKLNPDETENVLSFQFDTNTESKNIYPIYNFKGTVPAIINYDILKEHYLFFVQDININYGQLNEAGMRDLFEKDVSIEFEKIQRYILKK